VLQRQNFKDKVQKLKKAPPLQKPQGWATQIPNQLQDPTAKSTSKT
jgi:hypothetical protein